jgi:hypothetical protein
VSSTSGDASNSGQGELAIYGAERTSDGALTLVVLNKTAGDLSSSVSLAAFTPTGTAQVWRYSPANLSAVVREADVSLSGNSLNTTFPASSITLLVVSSATVVVLPDGGPTDGVDAGPQGGPVGTASKGVQGQACSSAPGPLGSLTWLGLLLLAFSRPRGRASPPPRFPPD